MAEPQVNKWPAAQRDLSELGEYLVERNPAAALRFLNAAERTFALLASMPTLGSVWETDNPKYQGMRYFRIAKFKKYVIFYRPTAEGIEVIRVLHSARDLDAAFE